MSNITNNRVSAVLTGQDKETIKKYLQQVTDLMPFLIGLTVDERKTLPKANDSNKTFIEDSVGAISNNLHMLPAYFQPNEIKLDIDLFSQLDEIELIIGQLHEKISDTRMLAGSEAYVMALTSYRLFAAGAAAGVPGADTIYEKLQVRFADQGNFSKKEEEIPPAQTIPPVAPTAS